MTQTLLQPMTALIAWTLVMWVWMYATRLPAMAKAKINPQDARAPGALNALPASVRYVADNYNHLHEQPTLFYAITTVLLLAQQDVFVNIIIAWVYVGLRVAHSLVQATVNHVPTRFALFTLATLTLVMLTVHAVLSLFHLA